MGFSYSECHVYNELKPEQIVSKWPAIIFIIYQGDSNFIFPAWIVNTVTGLSCSIRAPAL